MEILDKLSMLKDEELKNILTDNPYKSKFYFMEEEDIHNYIIVERGTNICKNKFIDTEGNGQTLENMRPLKLTDLKNIITSKRYSFLGKCSDELFIRYLDEVASIIYPKERYEVKQDGIYTTIIVWYPQINITNSVEEKHTIYDLYYRLKFYHEEDSTRQLSEFSMCRSSLSESELKANYQFSHCQGSAYFGWQDDLCLGRTELKNIMKNFEYGTFTSIQSLLLMLDSYFQWESLEGVPYVTIGKVKREDALGNLERDYSLYYDVKKHFILLNYILDIQLEYIFTPNGVKLTSESISKIDTILTEKYPSLCCIEKDGYSYRLKNDYLQYQKKEGKVLFTFKENPVISKVIKDETKELVLTKKIHRNILTGIVNEIEMRISDKIHKQRMEEVI